MNIKHLFHLLLLATFSLTGCAGVKNSMRPSDKFSQWNPLVKLSDKEQAKKDKKGDAAPETMAVIWKDAVFEKPGVAPVKGFGGRLYFYDANSNPVKVDGELVVYGFDDTDKESRPDVAKDVAADKRFIFPSEALQSRYSETDLGASYSVWVPWEKVGGNRKTITLIPVFKLPDGRVLKSGSSINVLPGKNPDVNSNAVAVSTPNLKLKKSSTGIAQAGFEVAAIENGNSVENASLESASTEADSESETEAGYNQPRIRTSTIQLTPAFASRLATTGNLNSFAPPAVNNKAVEPSPPATPPVARTAVTQPASEGNAETNKTISQKPSPSAATTNHRPVFGTPGSFR